jgi:hypothetical protein
MPCPKIAAATITPYNVQHGTWSAYWLSPPFACCASGSFHGFKDCAWLTTSLQLCYKYANSLYAFHNLAHTKAW